MLYLPLPKLPPASSLPVRLREPQSRNLRHWGLVQVERLSMGVIRCHEMAQLSASVDSNGHREGPWVEGKEVRATQNDVARHECTVNSALCLGKEASHTQAI